MADVRDTKDADPAAARPKRRWNWLRYASAAICVVLAVFAIDWLTADHLDFDVETQTGFPGAQGLDKQLPLMSIQSRNDEKIVIKRLLINNDDKCIPTFKPPMEMALGDTFTGMYFCNPVKVEIVTNRGTISYKFKN